MSDDKKEESKSAAEEAAEEVKGEVTEAVEETVEAVAEEAAEEVKDEVTEAVEETVEAVTEEAAEEVKDEVTETVEETVEAVTEEAAEEVKEEVTEAVEETVEAVAEEAAEETEEKTAPKEAEPEAKEEKEAGKEEEKAPETAEAKSEEAADGAKPEKSEKLKKAEEILREHSGSDRDEEEDLFEKVVFINRCAKVVKGGRRFSFSALVVSGNREGSVGVGFGKAKEVAECIKKASESSKKDMVKVKVTRNTIPHPVIGVYGGGRVLLRPASPGTGLIAGGGVRAVVEAAGIKDILAKSMGSNNHANVVKATLDALDQLRTKEEIYALRGKRIPDKKAL